MISGQYLLLNTLVASALLSVVNLILTEAGIAGHILSKHIQMKVMWLQAQSAVPPEYSLGTNPNF